MNFRAIHFLPRRLAQPAALQDACCHCLYFVLALYKVKYCAKRRRARRGELDILIAMFDAIIPGQKY
jgi:hypothetical protein